MHFTATQTGKYEIVCTQLCGLGHYNMKAYLEVMSEGDYEQWLKTSGAIGLSSESASFLKRFFSGRRG